jgi:hypothetical protein
VTPVKQQQQQQSMLDEGHETADAAVAAGVDTESNTAGQPPHQQPAVTPEKKVS